MLLFYNTIKSLTFFFEKETISSPHILSKHPLKLIYSQEKVILKITS